MSLISRRISLLIISFLLVACNSLPGSTIPTPYPTEYLPTVIAMTLAAGKSFIIPQATDTPTPEATPNSTQTSEPSSTPLPTFTQTNNPAKPISPPFQAEAPTADIQIRGLGQLSKVASPITVNAYLKPGAQNRVQVELLGEDSTILARQIVVLPWIDGDGKATLYIKLDFEIPSTAEAGRLRISTTDGYGRTTAVSSVPLVLISIGQSDILPPADMLAPLFIDFPTNKSLVQGKSLLVHGWSRPNSDNYLMLQLLGEDGQVLGKRVTNMETPGPNGYGGFTAEVPYFVTAPTPALLVVWEGEGSLSNIIYLTSVEVLLSP